ncbi:MAG: rRNA maturation RNase YbeY [Planctomycetota bacterium]
MTAEVAWDVPGEPLLAPEDVSRAVDEALEEGGRPGVLLGVVFVDAARLTQMHADYLDDPSETDVITFDLGEEGGGPAGELYVSVDRARELAERRGVPVERELALYVVHGALHLCGFDDHEDDGRAAMRRAERAVLERLGYPPDDQPHDLA